MTAWLPWIRIAAHIGVLVALVVANNRLYGPGWRQRVVQSRAKASKTLRF